jgi:hypothetical protein
MGIRIGQMERRNTAKRIQGREPEISSPPLNVFRERIAGSFVSEEGWWVG